MKCYMCQRLIRQQVYWANVNGFADIDLPVGNDCYQKLKVTGTHGVWNTETRCYLYDSDVVPPNGFKQQG